MPHHLQSFGMSTGQASRASVLNLVWSDKAVNSRKGNRLPHAAGLKLLHAPLAPKELLALLRNARGIAEWKLFLNE